MYKRGAKIPSLSETSDCMSHFGDFALSLIFLKCGVAFLKCV